MDMASQVAQLVKHLPANAREARDVDSVSALERSPEGGRQPVPIFLPGKSQGQRSMMGYNLLGRKELDKTETEEACTCMDAPVYLLTC